MGHSPFSIYGSLRNRLVNRRENGSVPIFAILVALAVAGACVAWFSLGRSPENPGQVSASGPLSLEQNVALWKKELAQKPDRMLYEKTVSAYIYLDELEQARNWAQRGLTHFPGCANLVFNLALIDFYEKDYAGALASVNSVLEKNNYFRDAHYLKGLILEASGDSAGARREYVEEINVNPGSRKAWLKIKTGNNR